MALEMDRETITKIEVNDTGELLLSLESNGDPTYQYIYRAASGVYWDQDKYGFKSTPMKKDRSCFQWYNQIISAVKSELGVEMILSKNVSCTNLAEKDKAEILQQHAI
jgi:hypothetical protein